MTSPSFDFEAANGVLEQVAQERLRQHDKFGEQNWTDYGPDNPVPLVSEAEVTEAREMCQKAADAGVVSWDLILYEELAEAFAETEPDRLRAELLQVAAVVVAWIEAIDRRAAAADRYAEIRTGLEAENDDVARRQQMSDFVEGSEVPADIGFLPTSEWPKPIDSRFEGGI